MGISYMTDAGYDAVRLLAIEPCRSFLCIYKYAPLPYQTLPQRNYQGLALSFGFSAGDFIFGANLNLLSDPSSFQ